YIYRKLTKYGGANKMIEEIGKTAGEIWNFLNLQSKPVNLAKLKKNISASSNILIMALGWLAREDKLHIEISEDSYEYKISLKK
ncbi:MAG: winged helix-turn-helix domain-containing protein, partial [bacterium]